jgi:hypothetical protein
MQFGKAFALVEGFTEESFMGETKSNFLYKIVILTLISQTSLGQTASYKTLDNIDYEKKEKALIVLISPAKRNEVKKLLEKSKNTGLSNFELNYLRNLIKNDLNKLTDSPTPLISN